MNEALALGHGSLSTAVIDTINEIGARLAFVGFPSKRASKQISGSAEDALKGVAALLEQMLLGVIDKRTAMDFKAVSEETIPNYMRLMFAVGSLIQAVVPPNVRDRVTSESLCEMEAEFRDHALAAFGSSIRDQCIFTVWTLRKISDVANQIGGNAVSEDLKEQDKQFASMFAWYGLRVRFHLDCLLLSMRTNRPIYPEVLEVISGELRGTVNAYAWIRKAAALRSRPEEPVLPFIDMDEEDQLFVEASAYDMANEPVENAN